MSFASKNSGIPPEREPQTQEESSVSPETDSLPSIGESAVLEQIQKLGIVSDPAEPTEEALVKTAYEAVRIAHPELEDEKLNTAVLTVLKYQRDKIIALLQFASRVASQVKVAAL